MPNAAGDRDPGLPAHIRRISTRDPDEYCAWFASHYTDHERRVRAGASGFGLVAEFGSLGGLSVARSWYSSALAEVVWAEPPQVFVSHLLRGRYVTRWRGGEVRMAGRGVLLFPPAGYAHENWSSDNRAVGIGLDTVLRAGEELAGVDRSAFRFTGIEPISAAAEQQWMATAAYVQTGIYDLGLRHPLLLRAAEEMVAASLLATFPNTTMTDEARRRHGWCAPAPVRRAVAFIDDGAHRPITLTDIATAAGVGARTLQHAFRRHRGCSPLAYLWTVRLARAHDALVAAQPGDGTTVELVAARWGFARRDRFVADYRRSYGCSPGRTMRS